MSVIRRQQILEERRKRLSEQRTSSTPTPDRTQQPTQVDRVRNMTAEIRRMQSEALSSFRETQKTAQQAQRSRPLGETLTSPQTTPTTGTPFTDPKTVYLERMQAAGGTERDWLRKNTPFGKFLFGESEQLFRGITERPRDESEGFFSGLREDVRSRGVIKGLLYQNVTKEPQERYFEGIRSLQNLGYTEGEAAEFSRKYLEGQTDDIPDAARSQLRLDNVTRKSWALVEMLDAFPVFRAGRQTLGRTFVRDRMADVMNANTAAEAREILTRTVPNLQGTRELEDIITTARQISDPVQGDAILRRVAQAETRTPATPTTPAQGQFFGQGTPEGATLRAGVDGPQAIREALELRDEIRSVLAGEQEASRLSNPNIFTNEVEAGALPFSARLGDKVRMFVPDEATTLRPGERLATSRQVMEQSLQRGKARMVEVMPDDVVRLADGTFTYAPKSAVGRNIQPTLRSLREGQRRQIDQIERRRTETRERRQQLQEEIAERNRIRAAQRAEQARQERVQQLSEARRTVQSGERQIQSQIESLRSERATRLTNIREEAKTARSRASEIQKTIRSLVTSVSRANRQAARERTKARNAISRTRNLKTVDAAEKRQRIERIRRERDRNLERIRKERTKNQERLTRERGRLAEAEKNIPDVRADSAAIRAQYKSMIDEARRVGRERLTEAQRIVRDAEGTQAKERLQRMNTQSQKATNDFTNTFKDNFSSVREKTQTQTEQFGNLRPLKGDGELIANQVVKEMKDELDAVYKSLGINDVNQATAEQLRQVPNTHRVASNEGQVRSAVQRVGSDPQKAYSDLVDGVILASDTNTVASVGMVLLRSDYVRQSATRTMAVERILKNTASASAQELQAFQIFTRMDYPSIVGRFMRQAEDTMKARNIDVEKEVGKAMQVLGDEFDKVMVTTRANMAEAVTRNTCKV